MPEGKVSLHFESCLLVSVVLNQSFSLAEPDTLALPDGLLKNRLLYKFNYSLGANTNRCKIVLIYLNVKENDF